MAYYVRIMSGSPPRGCPRDIIRLKRRRSKKEAVKDANIATNLASLMDACVKRVDVVNAKTNEVVLTKTPRSRFLRRFPNLLG